MIITDPTIAVVVCTVPNRRKKLMDCIHSILQNSVLPEEIFVVCDDTDDVSLPPSVQVIHIKETGVSNKKNAAIHLATSAIMAFTDDDCLVSKTWVKNIKKILL